MEKTKTKKKVEFFTDDMHMAIFPFQPAISARGYSGNKAIMKTLTVKTSRPGKTRVR